MLCGLSTNLATLVLARRRHPNGPNSLDALCARYGIDTSRRVKHGALLDAELLADVYLELLGGRQSSLALAASTAEFVSIARLTSPPAVRPRPLPPRLSTEDVSAHDLFLAELGAGALWTRYRPQGVPA